MQKEGDSAQREVKQTEEGGSSRSLSVHLVLSESTVQATAAQPSGHTWLSAAQPYGHTWPCCCDPSLFPASPSCFLSYIFFKLGFLARKTGADQCCPSHWSDSVLSRDCFNLLDRILWKKARKIIAAGIWKRGASEALVLSTPGHPSFDLCPPLGSP